MLKSNLYYISVKLYFNDVVRIQYSVIFCDMGLQCSKQGSLRFEDYSETRVSPEGEYDPLKFSSSLPSEEKKSDYMNLENCKHKDSLKDMRTSKESKWSTIDETFVELPPEKGLGDNRFCEETTSNKEQFQYDVQNVKNSKDLSDYESSINDSYSNLSNSERQSRSSRDSRDSMFSLQFKESETTESGHIDRWTYTLYDFQGKGIVSKKDFRQLIETVYNTVKQDSKHKDSLGHSLKIHVEIERQCNSIKEKSSKYSSSKVCKGMIFPPPNTEEAEKISNYIEKKLYRHSTSNRTEHNYLKKKCSHCNVKNDNLFCCKDNFNQPHQKYFKEDVKDPAKNCCLCANSSICCVREHSSSCRLREHSSSCRFRGHSSSCKLSKVKLKDSTSTFSNKNNLHQFRIKHLCTSRKNFVEDKPTQRPFFDTTRNSDFTINTEKKSCLRKDRQKISTKSSDGSEKSFKDLCLNQSPVSLKHAHSSFSRPEVWPGECVTPVDWTPGWPRGSYLDQSSPIINTKNHKKYIEKNTGFCVCKRLSDLSYSYHGADYTSCVGNSGYRFPSFIPAL